MATKQGRPTNKRNELPKIICQTCGKERSITNFYKSTRNEYKDTGYCNVCKSCLGTLIINQSTHNIDRDKVKNELCLYLDIPFIPILYTELMQKNYVNASNFIGEYKKALNLKSEWKNLKCSDGVKFELQDIQLEDDKHKPKQEVTSEMITYWVTKNCYNKCITDYPPYRVNGADSELIAFNS